MKAVNSPWHDPLSSELCCSPGPYTLKAFCSPQALEPQRFPQRRPLGSHLAARGYLSQALIFSVDLSWLFLCPRVFFRGHAKNQRLPKPSTHFSHKNSCFVLELDRRSGLGGSGHLGGMCGAGQGGMMWSLTGQRVPISTGTLEVAPSSQPRELGVPPCSPP